MAIFERSRGRLPRRRNNEYLGGGGWLGTFVMASTIRRPISASESASVGPPPPQPNAARASSGKIGLILTMDDSFRRDDVYGMSRMGKPPVSGKRRTRMEPVPTEVVGFWELAGGDGHIARHVIPFRPLRRLAR